MTLCTCNAEETINDLSYSDTLLFVGFYFAISVNETF
jgi:hypothetical protein